VLHILRVPAERSPGKSKASSSQEENKE